MNIEKFYNTAYAWLVNYGPRFLLGVLAFFCVRWHLDNIITISLGAVMSLAIVGTSDFYTQLWFAAL
jgi:hypothetical protein